MATPRPLAVYFGHHKSASSWIEMIGKETELDRLLIKLISESNGVSLGDTLDLATHAMIVRERPEVMQDILEFREQLHDFNRHAIDIDTVLEHNVARSLGRFFQAFPKPFQEEHIHLSGLFCHQRRLPLS